MVGNLLLSKFINIREISPNIEYENAADTLKRLYIFLLFLKIFSLEKNEIVDKNRIIYENIN